MSSRGGVDTALLGGMVRQKRLREGKSLRELAKEIKISAPTLQRAEAREIPSAATLVRLTSWLGIATDDVCKGRAGRSTETLEEIDLHLRADPKLNGETAEAISRIVRDLYGAFTRAQEKK